MPKKKQKSRKTKSYWEFVNDVVGVLQRNFYLHKWMFSLQQARDPKEQCRCGNQALAEISILNRYFKATITCYPGLEELYNEGKTETVARCLVHEFCHVLTEPLYDTSVHGVTNSASDFLEYIREQSTQHLAVILFDLLPSKIFSVYKDSK